MDLVARWKRKRVCYYHVWTDGSPIPELKSGNFMQRSFGERVAMNSPIQGTAADIIKIAMNRVYQAPERRRLKVQTGSSGA